MEKDNILLLLTPKTGLVYLSDEMSIRQGLEKLKVHSYTAIPLIEEKTGKYLGTVTEGDFLREITASDTYELKKLESRNIKTIVRKGFIPAVKITAGYADLLRIITTQNFVPIVDDREVLMGIVTRRSVIDHLRKSL